MDGRSEQDNPRDADDVTEAEAHARLRGPSEEPAEAEAHGIGSPLGSDEASARRDPGGRR